jgi:methyl-accepting chemotaxis protein
MTIGKKIAGGYCMALVFVAVMGALFFWSTQELIKTNAMVTNTHDSLEALEKLISYLKDAETGLQGFLLTEDEKFLASYKKAMVDYPSARRQLKNVFDDWLEKLDDAENGKYLKEELFNLDRALFAYTTFTNNVIKELGKSEDTKKKSRDVAIATIKEGIGKGLMDKVRDQVNLLQIEERKLLIQRQAAADKSVLVSTITIGASTVLAFIMVGVGGYVVVRSVNTTVQHGVSQLASASAEILATTTQQAAGAQEQAAAVTETMTTVNEVAQTADEVSERAKTVGESVQKTLEIGKSGRKVVEESLVAMEVVKEKIETTAENILMLAEQAQAISDIIATVNDVAEQTNLLALNAAIEASRAGEHGKGFTVVASEVKVLAEQSKKATAQVRQILGEIQKATNSAVLSTEEVTKGLASAIKVGVHAGQTIKTLADTLADVSRSAMQIIASISQQATGMTEINQAMKNIDEVAKQNAVAACQASRAAENLNQLGIRLGTFIGK